MAPPPSSRRPTASGKGSSSRLVAPCVLFILATNVSYQICRGLWRPMAAPLVARYPDTAAAAAQAG
eukprot:CAMPEP_0197606760 /NCGR_PEP_ID=MMETSP1326-20131121/45732_1 /TAXON_ID=1155430 /ORGANISM="Genus nov. species nov., Strain RCC2288" /LENGTH=65 /DNA_ID=CAMNT_0043174727 /DNA_START=77 /DNA_END=270 /DNA_ORIENTATION=-